MELRTRAAIVAIMAVLFAASCAHEQALARGKMTAMLPAAPAGYKWQMVPSLSDEFSGNTLDKSKWLPYQPYWPGRAPSQFDPKNVSEQGGCLLLKSTTTHDSLAGIADPNDDPWISSACVSSSTPRASYGYYEARVKASDLPMTSSFWFQGKYSEIDVVEQIGASVRYPQLGGMMLMNTHYFKNGWANDKSTTTWKPMSGGSAADAYHVYGVWWKDDHTIILYNNGVETAEITPGGAFDEPMYMFFDTEAFASWQGLPTIADLKDPSKNTMSVDWVRSWQLVPIGAKTKGGGK